MNDMERTVCAEDVLNMIDDTSRLLSDENKKALISAASAYRADNALAENVEFWKWMNQNYSSANGHMFSSNSAMKEYIAQGQGKSDWMYKQLQGKGYEWDWMQTQRNSLRNIFKRYDAGTVSNQPGYDVLEHDFISGADVKYQMKAYTGRSNPDLHNTDASIKVVTNAEKADVVSRNGYQVEEYKNAGQIKEATDKRMGRIKDGSAAPSYNISNVACTMAKAGLIGAVTGITIEGVSSYKAWKEGVISDREYISEMLKAGGDMGITSAATAGIMLPVTATITAAGIAAPVTIPIAFVVSGAVNKIVAPCFARGEYKRILDKAKYYDSIEHVYDAFIDTARGASESYLAYVSQMRTQAQQHEYMKQKSMELNRQLKSLYNSI